MQRLTKKHDFIQFSPLHNCSFASLASYIDPNEIKISANFYKTPQRMGPQLNNSSRGVAKNLTEKKSYGVPKRAIQNQRNLQNNFFKTRFSTITKSHDYKWNLSFCFQTYWCMTPSHYKARKWPLINGCHLSITSKTCYKWHTMQFVK